MIFKTFQLIINDTFPEKSDINFIFTNAKNNFVLSNDVYLIDKELIEDRFFWMYCQYDNSKLYGDKVYDVNTYEELKNRRKKSQVELRKQLFVVYDLEEKILYINDINKKGFLKSYFRDALNSDVIIKNVYASLDEFRKSVKVIKKLKFTQIYNLFNAMDQESIFMQQANALGLDVPNRIVMQIEYGNTPIKKINEGLDEIRRKKDAGYFEDIILIGEDDEGIEQNFDFRTLVKSVEISVEKDENDRFKSDEVKKLFCERIVK